jgi:hypothetical protein
MKLNLQGAVDTLDATKVNSGIWIHLEAATPDPETGDPRPCYLNGNPDYPQRALVRYSRCQAVKAAESKQQKTALSKMRAAPKKEKDKVVMENSLLAPEDRFSHILVALENVGSEPGIQYVDPEDAKALYGMDDYDHWVQQINDVATTEAHYAATAATEAGNGSTSPPSSRAETTSATSED